MVGVIDASNLQHSLAPQTKKGEKGITRHATSPYW